jgi:hypothetical protein
MVAEAQRLAIAGKSIEQIWKDLNKYITENSLGPELSNSGERARQLKE